MQSTFRWLSFFIVLLCFNPSAVHAQKASFTATIGYQTYDVKNGDVLRVCRSSNITYNGTVNNGTVEWRFNNGNVFNPGGNGPYTIYYPVADTFQTVQKVTLQNASDSIKISIIVTDKDPNLKASFNIPSTIDCGSKQVSFTSGLTGNSLLYHWNLGDGTSDTKSTVTHTYNKAIGASGEQPYMVTLSIADISGCADSITKEVRVKKIPDATIGSPDPNVDTTVFNGLPTFRFCDSLADYEFSFINKSTTASFNEKYVITWGYGSPATTGSITWNNEVLKHTYPLGIQTLSLTITGNNGCDATKKYNVFLGSGPKGGINTPGNTEYCVGDVIGIPVAEITKNNPPGTIYTFTVNDGSKDTVLTEVPDLIYHKFAFPSCGISDESGQPNSFTARLIMSNPCFPYPSPVTRIHVSGRPNADFKVSPDTVACVNSVLLFDNFSDFGSVVTSSGECNRSGLTVWKIFPKTGFTLQSGSDTGNITGVITNINKWKPGTSDLQVKFTAPGTYRIKLYVINNRSNKCNFVDSVEHIVCIQDKQKPVFKINGINNIHCFSDTVSLQNQTTDGTCMPNDYLWSLTRSGSTDCGTGLEPVFTKGDANTFSPEVWFKEPGLYNILLKASAGNACWDTSSQQLLIKGKPKIKINPVSSICAKSDITVTADTNACFALSPLRFAWSFKHGSPDTANIFNPGSINYTSKGTYPIILYAKNECGTTIDSSSVVVTDKPLAEAGKDTSLCKGSMLTLGQNTGPYQYIWSPATGLNSTTIAQPSFTPADNKDTTLKYFLTVSGGINCEATDSVTIKVKRSPVLAFNPLTPAICENNSLQLTASGADTYTWQPAKYLDKTTGDTVVTKPDSSITYTLTGKLGNGCSATTDIPVTVNRNARADFKLAKTTDCAGVDINTFVQLNTYESNAVYKWYVNDSLINTNTTGTVPSYKLDSAGTTYTIKLVTQSDKDCKPDSMKGSFITGERVTTHFTRNKQSGCSPVDVEFTNDSKSSPGVEYTWNFGNGAQSNLTQPGTISFTNDISDNDTTYYITLTASNGCNNASWKDSVTVFPKPKARFAAVETNGCSPFTTTIYNRSSDSSIYYWDFGDGKTETRYNKDSFTHTYSTGFITTYPLHLKVQTHCGIDTQTIQILVSPNNIRPVISVDGNQVAACAAQNINFYNGSLGAATATWDFGDGTDPVTTPNDQAVVPHAYNDSGLYTIKVELKNDCSDTSITKQIRIYKNPVAAFTIDSLICTGNTIQPVNQSLYANRYQWQWGDGNTSPEQQPQHSYMQSGLYAIQLTAQWLNTSGLTCTDSTVKQVRVIDRIAPQITLLSGIPCATYTAQVTATGADNASYINWTFFNADNSIAGTSTGITATHVYQTPGIYNIGMQLANAAGCADSTSTALQVFPTPHNVITNPFNAVTCNTDTTITFINYIQYAGTDAVNYQWYINGQQSGGENPFTYHFAVPLGNNNINNFNISVVAFNTAGCRDSSAFGEFVIRPVTKPFITVLPDAIQTQPHYEFSFNDTVTRDANNIYLWNFGDITRQQSSEKSPTYKYGDTGTYTVKLLVTDFLTGCKASDSIKVAVLAVPGYVQVPNAICPGCAKDVLRRFLPLARGLSEYHLWIYNAWGQLVFQSTGLDANGSPNEAWNGRWEGDAGKALLPQATYNWRIEARFKNGTEWKGMQYNNSSKPVKSGTVTVIR